MSEVRRVQRISDGQLGWLQDHAVHRDTDLAVAYQAIWRRFSEEDQEDFGVPPAAYQTACGLWLPADDA